ncbi:MAG: thioredoxin domain-containing protein [Methanoregula sp.]|nr:thioredoxin domain-containing protein [Methanoregula sp.]
MKAGKTQKQSFFSKGTLVAIIGIAVVIVILLVAGVTQNMPTQGAVVPAQSCAEKTLTYINNNLVSPGTSASLTSVTENRGMYEMKITYLGRGMTLYTTRDCSSLFTNSIDMNAKAGVSGTAPAQPAAAPIKTERPVVDLYVMAFCPGGTYAENVMKPVASLLGSKADIHVRYLTTTTGTTVASVQSLHGMPEAKEDLRQICILKKNPEKFWEYLGKFNDACYPQYQNAALLDACRGNVTAAIGIDARSIETCASGEEGLALLRADEALSNKYGASSSPTLIINGQEYRGTRTPDAYKQAICDRFVTPPAECSTILPSVPGTAVSGGCG